MSRSQLKIDVFMDSNEQQSWRRKLDVEEAVKDHAEMFAWRGFSELPVDLRFTCDTTATKAISVELKEPADLVASIATGHLSKQILALREANEPGFIVCIGSVQDVFNAIPSFMPMRNITRYQQFSLIKHFCSTAYSNGYPVYFYDYQWAAFILANVEAILTVPSVLAYLHKAKTTETPAAMLTMIPGIGAETAKGLLASFGSIRRIMDVPLQELERTQINGRKIGKKAKAIVEAFK